MVCNQVCRGIREITVEAIIFHVESWDNADRITDLESADPFTDGRNCPRGLIPETGGKLWHRKVLAGSKHHLGAVQAQRMDLDLNLSFSGGRDLDLLDPQYFGTTDLVKSHYSCHSHSFSLSTCVSPSLKERAAGFLLLFAEKGLFLPIESS